MSSVMHCLSLVVLATLLTGAARASADQLQLDASPSYGVLKAGQKQTTWIGVGLAGFAMESETKRAPVNVALVFDRSGSMQGQKIARAREAAIDAVRRLHADDIVSVVTYDSTVNVLVPATRLHDKDEVARMISRIKAGGSTALFAGVSKGAAEIRKFLSEEHVNRVILLSDGLANVGPSSPGELGSLGASLKKDNISVSTFGLGLGYNEDLMVKLASRSGGNHEFVEEATELADIFNREFDDVTSVVAQEVKVRIDVPEGIRPVRVLGNDAEINGQEVLIDLSQVYSEQDKHVVLEVEIPSREDGRQANLACVSVTYLNMQSHATDRLTSTAHVTFSDSQSEVDASLNKDVLEDVVALVANEQNKLATDFLDEGDIFSCRQTLISNSLFLKEHADKLKSSRLHDYYMFNVDQASQVENADTNRARKNMRALQLQVDIQKAEAPSR